MEAIAGGMYPRLKASCTQPRRASKQNKTLFDAPKRPSKSSESNGVVNLCTTEASVIDVPLSLSATHSLRVFINASARAAKIGSSGATHVQKVPPKFLQ